MTRLLNIFLRQFFVVVLALLGLSVNAGATTIIYAGTFDPFHATHEAEVTLALELFPDARVLILPIEYAHYHDRYQNRLFPRLFTYEQRVGWIAQHYASDPRIQVASDLKWMELDVFHQFKTVIRNQHDDVKLLIGPDVLELWQKRRGFSELLREAQLVVTFDPRITPAQHHAREHFREHPRVTVLDRPKVAIRSRGVIWSLMRNEPAHGMLVETEAWIKLHPTAWAVQRMRYIDAVTDFFRVKLLETHALRSGEVETKLERLMNSYFGDSGRFKKFAQANLAIATEFDQFFKEVLMFATNAFTRDEFPFLYSDLYLLLRTPKMLSAMEELHFLRETLRDTASQSAGKARLRFGNVDKKLVSAIMRATAIDSDLVPPSSSLPVEEFQSRVGEETITLYRGVRDSPTLEKAVRFAGEDGFISKVALLEFLNGGHDLKEAIEKSKEQLAKQGTNVSVLDHVLGQFTRNSVFVANTFDFEIASQYAGKNGIVFEMEVPLSSGAFVSDPYFWKDTPWEKAGNPMGHLGEFVVFHQVRPEWIRALHRIEEPAVIRAAQPRSRSRMIFDTLVWKARTRFEKYGLIECMRLLTDDIGAGVSEYLGR